MNEPIDVIVLWVDPSVEAWQKEYNYWKDIEIKRKTQHMSNAGAFNTARYQDWNIFKYWFRGVERNCPWAHKIFLVVEDEQHVPKWLDRSNPKLRIVTHKEFIPEEALPQFNGPAIEQWYYRIPDLSENFIACDDDYFFLSDIPEDWFFEDNVPCTKIIEMPLKYTNIPGLTWFSMRDNDKRLMNKIAHKSSMFNDSHLPEPRKKSFEKKIIEENYDEFYNALMYSHFRSYKSYTAWVFIDLMKTLGISKNKDVYRKSLLCSLTGRFLIENFKNKSYQMICFNDIEGEINKNLQRKLIALLNSILPNPCGFEIGGKVGANDNISSCIKDFESPNALLNIHKNSNSKDDSIFDIFNKFNPFKKKK